MSEHLSIPISEDHDRKLPNQSFIGWLFDHKVLFVSQVILAIVGIAYSLFGLYYYYASSTEKYSKYFNGSFIREVIYYAHIGFIIFFIFILFYIYDDNNRGSYRIGRVYRRIFGDGIGDFELENLRHASKVQLRKFKLYFIYFWFAMLGLYLSFAFSQLQDTNKDVIKKDCVQIKVNETGKIGYLITEIKEPKINKPEVSTHHDEPSDNPAKQSISKQKNAEAEKEPCSNKVMYPGEKAEYVSVERNKIIKNPFEPNNKDPLEIVRHLFFPFLIFAFNNLSMMFIFYCFTVLYLPLHDKAFERKQRFLVNCVKTIVGIFTVSYLLAIVIIRAEEGFLESHLTAHMIAFDAISGTLNALVLALLIARLDSKLIGLPSRLITVLYFYAAVQPLFVAFEQPGEIYEVIKTGVLIVVFIAKIYFFLIITYTMQTGRMLNYLFCFPNLNRRVDSIFENQFEFVPEKIEHSKPFTFLIKKANAHIYLSEVHFEDIEDCRRKIKDYKQIMKQKSSYYIMEIEGTYWVKVVDRKTKKIICYSVALKSKDEADDLIDESMEKIPYCKVG